MILYIYLQYNNIAPVCGWFGECVKNENVNGILIDPLTSNTKAIKFYENLGFEYMEDRTFGEGDEQDHCKVYFLSRKKWEMKNG